MLVLNLLSDALTEVRKSIIGIAYLGGQMELIVEVDGDSLTLIRITQWGALQTTYTSKSMVNKYVMFADKGYDNLYEFKQKPFEFSDFCKENKIY